MRFEVDKEEAAGGSISRYADIVALLAQVVRDLLDPGFLVRLFFEEAAHETVAGFDALQPHHHEDWIVSEVEDTVGEGCRRPLTDVPGHHIERRLEVAAVLPLLFLQPSAERLINRIAFVQLHSQQYVDRFLFLQVGELFVEAVERPPLMVDEAQQRSLALPRHTASTTNCTRCGWTLCRCSASISYLRCRPR